MPKPLLWSVECLPQGMLKADIAGILVEAHAGDSACPMQSVEEQWRAVGETSWHDQLARPVDEISWRDQLARSVGATSWRDQLARPVGTTSWRDQLTTSVTRKDCGQVGATTHEEDHDRVGSSADGGGCDQVGDDSDDDGRHDEIFECKCGNSTAVSCRASGKKGEWAFLIKYLPSTSRTTVQSKRLILIQLLWIVF